MLYVFFIYKKTRKLDFLGQRRLIISENQAIEPSLSSIGAYELHSLDL